jgi:acyl-CoA thioesterase
VGQYDVVLLGEVHDDPVAHHLELKLWRAALDTYMWYHSTTALNIWPLTRELNQGSSSSRHLCSVNTASGLHRGMEPRTATAVG